MGICFWRARTQSFTVDEAWDYHSFVVPPLGHMAEHYDACNHVLHTLLLKAAKWSLGGGELALRVPSLLAALLYCLACFRLTKLLLDGWAQVLCLALLLLNPMILDFLIAARGYGLALALFLWGLYSAINYTTRGFDPKWLFRAGVLLGLSISANLVMLIPAAALGLALLLLSLPEGARGCWRIFDTCGGPAITVAFLILVIPLLPAKPEDFYYGALTIPQSIDSLTGAFLKVNTRWPASNPDVFYAIGRYAVVPILLAGFLWGLAVALRRYLGSTHIEWRLSPFILFATTLLASLAATLALHALAGMKYPLGRTGLYLLPLVFLGAFYGLRLLDAKRWNRLRLAGNLAAAALVLICIRQTDNRYFKEWQFDAGTGRLMRALEADFVARGKPGQQQVRVAAQWPLSGTALWYRNRRNLNWMKEPDSAELDTRAYDYYLLTSEGTSLIEKLGLERISEDRVSGQILARRRP